MLVFADEKVEFVVIGGWAMALHGHGRGTDDLDVFIKATAENAARVYRALTSFGAPVAAHGVTAELFTQTGYGYRMGIKPHLIEILTQVDGIDFDEAIEESRTFELEGRAIAFIGRRALLKNKRAAGRPKDLADVDWLERHPPAGE
ncbi:MAG TPA: hypothetical protein VLC09_04400 [Polyangiaceae bacterium]|nr:hypothetical protein [Polyangiaceae bacterium]